MRETANQEEGGEMGQGLSNRQGLKGHDKPFRKKRWAGGGGEHSECGGHVRGGQPSL